MADSSPLGLHRVAVPEREAGILPQAAWRLDPAPEIGPDEVRVRVDRLNLDAASYRQLREANGGDGPAVGAAVRAAVLKIIDERGKMHNPVTGSGGMLTGIVEEAGPESPLGLKPGDRIATLVSLTLTPLAVTDGLKNWDGQSEQVPCEGHAILFGRSIAAVLPDDLPVPLALAALDVCGAPALTQRVVTTYVPPLLANQEISGYRTEGVGSRTGEAASRDARADARPVVAVLGAAGKSGSLSTAAARLAGAGRVIGVVPDAAEATLLRESGLADEVVIADARDPIGLSGAVRAAGGPADVTVVCVDVPGCEGGAILATAQGGTVIFFSMATSFSAAALGAEGVAADVTMLIGNGFAPGHANLALDLIRATPALRALFEGRLSPAPATRAHFQGGSWAPSPLPGGLVGPKPPNGKPGGRE
jgi:L-erythro-3,5-diaminohexanoate dehydrogenase